MTVAQHHNQVANWPREGIGYHTTDKQGKKRKAYGTQAVALYIGGNVRKTRPPALKGQQALMGTYPSPVPGCLKVSELALQ